MTKCPYCGEEFKNYNGLSKHIFKYKAHGCDITKEKLLCDVNYEGNRPKCKCKNHGINLIVVWEGEYRENKDDVIMKIKNKITLL